MARSFSGHSGLLPYIMGQIVRVAGPLSDVGVK